MAIVTNVITIPPPLAAPARALKATVGAAPSGPAQLYPGQLYNGHTRIFADVAPGDSGKVNIKFSVQINSIDEPTFHEWRQRVATILGDPAATKIASYSGITQDGHDAEGHASRYSLATFSYVTAGVCDRYRNQSDVRFDSRPDTTYQQIMESIFELDSSTIELQGELTATTANPAVEAFITATYFAFENKKVTSFAGYRGSIVLVDGDKEELTRPGILAPV